MDLSIVIPCYNEQESLPNFIKATLAALAPEQIRTQLVFVNDGSVDGTGKILEDLVGSQPPANIEIDVVEFSRNFGKEAAIFAGLEHATGDCCSIIDADLQQRPETLLDMYHRLVSSDEYDMVAAYQTVRHEGAMTSWLKRRFYGVFSKTSHTETIPGASDFRVFRRDVRDAVISMREYDRFSKGIFSWVGFPTLAWPYEPDDRAAGESKWGTGKLFRYAFGGIMSFTTLPLRVSTTIGIISCVAALVYGIFVLVDTFVLHNTPAGYPTIVLLILLIGGLQLLFLGIIGEYLARVYTQAKDRPIYIARRVLSTGGGSPASSSNVLGAQDTPAECSPRKQGTR